MYSWLLAIIALLYLRDLKLMEIGLQTKCGDAVWNSEALPDVSVLSSPLLLFTLVPKGRKINKAIIFTAMHFQ